MLVQATSGCRGCGRIYLPIHLIFQPTTCMGDAGVCGLESRRQSRPPEMSNHSSRPPVVNSRVNFRPIRSSICTFKRIGKLDGHRPFVSSMVCEQNGAYRYDLPSIHQATYQPCRHASSIQVLSMVPPCCPSSPQPRLRLRPQRPHHTRRHTRQQRVPWCPFCPSPSRQLLVSTQLPCTPLATPPRGQGSRPQCRRCATATPP